MTRRRLIPGISRHSFIEAVRARQWPLLSARGGGAESEERSFALMFEASPRTYVSWIELTEIPRMPFVEVDGDEPDLQLSQEIATVCQSLDDATLLALPEHAGLDLCLSPSTRGPIARFFAELDEFGAEPARQIAV